MRARAHVMRALLASEFVASSVLLGLVGARGRGAQAFSPYTAPAAGWSYFLEAAHPANLWPQCAARFMSFPTSCDGLDLWSGAGDNQQFELELVQDQGSRNGTAANDNVSHAAPVYYSIITYMCYYQHWQQCRARAAA